MRSGGKSNEVGRDMHGMWGQGPAQRKRRQNFRRFSYKSVLFYAQAGQKGKILRNRDQ
jgi:hypothetical protein